MNDKIVLRGQLGFVGLPEIFQILGNSSDTGILYMKTHGVPGAGMIYFVEGNPVNANNGSLRGRDAVCSLFGWTEGEFEFHKGEVRVLHEIKQGRMEIVLDALRMLDDGIIRKIGPSSEDNMITAAANYPGWMPEYRLPSIRGPLVDYSYVMHEEFYHEGDPIAKEGGHGKWMWTIYEGSVQVDRETANGPLPVAFLREGSFIGTFNALLFGEYERSATVTARRETRLCLLDTIRLHREFSSLSPNFRALLLSMDRTLKKITDRVVQLIMKEDGGIELYRDKDRFTGRNLANEPLFKILEGEALVVLDNEQGNLPLVSLGSGDIYGGEGSFFDTGNGHPLASILPSKDLRFERLDTADLQKEYNSLSATIRNMCDNTKACISEATKAAFYLYEKSSSSQ